jgi:segregation and condensation protein B
MDQLLAQIESILFVASKPLAPKTIAASLGTTAQKVEDALETLKMKYNRADSGIHILFDADMVQMGTHPDHGDVVGDFLKQEATGELTKAQLETLTVIAYRGPMTRPEIEQIRGVNCAVIVRNLLMRGLIEEEQGKEDLLPVYRLSMDAMAHLGIDSPDKLPEYEVFHSHEYMKEFKDSDE